MYITRLEFEAGAVTAQFRELQEFLGAAKLVRRLGDLTAMLDAFVRELGFDYYALVDHVDLLRGEQPELSVSSYPQGWREILSARGYFPIDPVNAACQCTSLGFAWSEVPELIELSPKQMEILTTAAREGMGHGYTVPIHVPGERTGSSSFAVRSGKTLPDSATPVIQYLGCFAFEAARRLNRSADPFAPVCKRQRLSNRQRDCVTLVARGKSDWEIAKLLDLRPDTVHEYVEEAKRRYGVRTRQQLIVSALYDSQITYRDTIARSP